MNPVSDPQTCFFIITITSNFLAFLGRLWWGEGSGEIMVGRWEWWWADGGGQMGDGGGQIGVGRWGGQMGVGR